MINFSTMEKLVGAFILLIIAAFFGSLILVGRGQHWFKAYNTYYAVYKQGYDLQPGVKVKILRTEIGYVSAVDLTKNNQARVTMRLLAEYASHIRAGSTAAIESPTLIGSEFINISPGPQDKPIIEPGGVIPSEEAKKITDYLEEYEFAAKMEQLDRILTNVADITAQLKDPDSGLTHILANVEGATAPMREGRGTLGLLLHDDTLYRQVEAEVAAIEDVIQDLDQAVQKLDRALAQTNEVTALVRDRAPSILDGVPSLIRRIDGVVGQIDRAMTTVNQAVDETPAIARSTRERLREVGQVLDSVKQNILVRGNLPAPPSAESHGVQLSGD
jgi:phospholipid/cholesterol/gamma-HCH transport system substrate-binding protein